MKISDIILEKNKQSRPIVYLDLDGVLADLYNYAAEIHDVEHYAHMTNDEWQEFFRDSDAYHLFSSIPAFPNIKEIISLIETYTDDYIILSSPLNFDEEGSIRGKKEWIAKNIPGKPRVIFDHEKFKYARQEDGTPNVLIDDYKGNTIPWEKQGGIAIKFQNDEDHISKIKDGLERAFRGK
jgi:hypothetical protein